MANQYTKTKIDHARIIELYRSGMTQAEVAQEMGVTQKVIWQRLKQEGVKCRVAFKRNQLGQNNNSWKGDAVSYSAFHFRIQSLKGKPQKCEECGTNDSRKTYDWANLTGRYNDPSDYKRMCRSCHWKHDKKHLNFKGGKSNAQKDEIS